MSEVLGKPARKTTAKVAAPKAKPTLGAAIDTLWQLREDKKAAAKKVDDVDVQIKALEADMFELLDAQDTRKAEGKRASVSIGEAVVANVEDWPAFHAYIAKNKFFHLLQKRVSDPGYRELLGLGKVVPGVSPFTKRTLSVRSL